MKKSSVAWLFAVIVLSVLLAISIILGLTGYYFSVAYLNSAADLTIGNNFTINVGPNQSNVASFTFDGGYLPGELIPQVVQIGATNLDADVRVRIKALAFGINQNVEFDFVTTEHFEKYEDGYYYYDEILGGGNKITFCNYLIIPKEDYFSSQEKYIITFVVETLENRYDEQNIWKNV